MILQIAAAFAAVAAFSIIMDAPKRYLFYCGSVGAAGWLVYLLTAEACGVLIGNFIGAAAVSLLSHLCARFLKAPVTVFLIPGFLPLVPGFGLYRTVYYFFTGSKELGEGYLIQTIQIAGAIALGIFVVDSVFGLAQRKYSRKDDGEDQK